ncbi:hypothetical protein [Lysinibacillus fusiformis]|uniref:hypothetical protein n=1 Tax=Lysinibacillus fusiformis TaxID=28031 RepID=UPI00263AB997|nr:hypothetical protein [Lysinibacillus fusiformis]MDC6267246.1 hypothetical protein [Lysinibacillus sphaericus]MDN4968320.1 hypothetical protein [Lysinibacillus fusiformis]MDN4968494.1 hypothetical protein [Lysinibacillus fusiformis]
MDKLEEILNQLNELREEVLNLKESVCDEKLEWYETDDKIKIEDSDSNERYLILAANKDAWVDVKEEDDPLYLELHNYDKDCWMNLTLDSMIQLRDYLTHKIDYLMM